MITGLIDYRVGRFDGLEEVGLIRFSAALVGRQGRGLGQTQQVGPHGPEFGIGEVAGPGSRHFGAVEAAAVGRNPNPEGAQEQGVAQPLAGFF